MNPPQQTQTESSKAETPSQKLKPLIVEMTTELTSNHPSNIPEFLLNYLQQKNGYSNSGLTPSQRFELENLRRELLKYKKMEEHEKFIQEPKEQKEKGKNIPLPSKEIESEDDDDDIDFELDDEAKNKIRVGDKKRNAVCAEVKGSGMINEPKDNKDKDKDKDKEINQENKESKENQEKNENKEIKENKESKENKENKDDIKEVPQVKENSIKLVLVKVFIGVIFFLLSVIIILFVRIKSLQKRKANYIELTGIDSV